MRKDRGIRDSRRGKEGNQKGWGLRREYVTDEFMAAEFKPFCTMHMCMTANC